MGVDMRWLRTGTALKGNFMGKLPLKGKITVDPVDSKVTIKYDPPQEVKMHFEPILKVYRMLACAISFVQFRNKLIFINIYYLI